MASKDKNVFEEEALVPAAKVAVGAVINTVEDAFEALKKVTKLKVEIVSILSWGFNAKTGKTKIQLKNGKSFEV